VSRRPLVFVSALTVGDYLLWNWSLGGNHDLLALLAGLTLPPLALACLWLLAIGLARLIGGAARRRPGAMSSAVHQPAGAVVEGALAPIAAEQTAAVEGERPPSPRKLAA
jgi:hypothetical protein